MAEHEKAEKHEEGHGGGSHGGGGHGGGGHGGGGGHEEHEGAPEWLISFADNVALMMGFFVILLAMNMKKETAGGIGGEKALGGTPNAEMIDFVLAMREGFNNPVSMGSTNPSEKQLVARLRQKQAESNEQGRTGRNERVQSVRPSNFSNLGGSANFLEGSSMLSETEKEGVKQIAQAVWGLRWIVEVRGHVSAAESVRDPRAGWKLSYERAYATAQALVDGGMDWKQIRLVACGTNGSNTPGRQYDSSALRGDQRAEIIVTNEPMPDGH